MKALFSLFLFLTLAIGSVANAQVEPKNLGSALRTVEIYVPKYWVSTGTASGTYTNGVNGVVCLQTINGVTAPSCSLLPPPYPARLNYKVFDGNGDDTLTCTSITFVCTDASGILRKEVKQGATKPTETQQLTDFAYESCNSITAVGCTGGDSSDSLMVSVSAHLALAPAYVRSTTPVVAACLFRTNIAGTLHCAAGSGLTARAAPYNTVDVSALTFPGLSGAPAVIVNGMGIRLRTRSATY